MSDFIDTFEEKMASLISEATAEDLLAAIQKVRGNETSRITYAIQQGDYTGAGLVIYGMLRRHFLSRAMREADKSQLDLFKGGEK